MPFSEAVMFRLQRKSHIFIFWMILGMLWVTCTQKSPLDPTEPLHEQSAMFVDMAASPKTIGIGGAYSLISARLIDDDTTPIKNRYVRFSATIGTITDSARTDTAGYVQAIFRSSEIAGTATITATYNKTIICSIQVEVVEEPDVSLTVQLGKHSLLANGIDSALVTVYLVGDSVSAVEADLVNVFTSDGSLAYTGSSQFVDGVASLLLTSPCSVTDISGVVTATFEEYTAIDTIKFKGINFQLTATPNQILADGQSTSTIMAILKETSSGIAIPKHIISFGTNLGLIPASEMTDERGLVEVTYTSSTSSGEAEIIATYGATMTRRVTIDCLAKAGALYVIQEATADPTSILANGVNTSTISVEVLDKENHPVLNDSIHFETTRGQISQEWVLTNSSGIAEATLTASPSEVDSTAQVRVSRGGDIQSKTLNVKLLGVQMELTANPLAIIADGESQSTLSVVLKQTTNKIAVSNAEVTFATDYGLIASSAQTNSSGLAKTTLTSSKTPQTATVVSQYGLLADTVEVAFLSEGENLYTISNVTTSSYRILANGEEEATISVTVVDSDGDPAVGDTIGFECTAGAFDRAYAVTNLSGIASASFIPKASAQDSTATITATRAGGLVRKNLDRTITLVGLSMNLYAVPTAILANGESQSQIIVVLKENLSQVGIAGAQIQFATSEGLIPNSATTNTSGRAEVALTSSQTPATATVTVRYGQIVRTTPVSFLSSTPEHLVVTVSPSSIPADGTTAATITAVITDFDNNPVPSGITVTFTKLSGPSVSFVGQKVTGTDGTASTSLTALGIGTVVVEVTVASLRDTVSIVCVQGSVAQITLDSDIDEIRANASDVARLTATVTDANGNRLSGKLVTFSTTVGNVTQSVTTNNSGQAVASFSSGTVGNAVITASVQKSTTETITASTTIKLVAGYPASIEMEFDPQEMGVKNTGQNQTVNVIATVKDAQNNTVEDGTPVRFWIVAPGLSGVTLDMNITTTIGGEARVACSSGIQAGSVRIGAEALKSDSSSYSPKIESTSAQLIVHAGPPYIEDINNIETSHMTLEASRYNIYAGLDTTQLTVFAVDRYNNPAEITKIYFTASGGGVEEGDLTDDLGLVNAILRAGQPYPTINRFYDYEGMQDPNLGTIIPESRDILPDFDGGLVDNSHETYGTRLVSDGEQNNGIARVIAKVPGFDADSNSVWVWNWIPVIYSTVIAEFSDNSADVFPPGDNSIEYGDPSRTITITIWDTNGNPIASRSKITATLTSDVQASLSWTEWVTGDGMGRVYYPLTITNSVDTKEPKGGWTKVRIAVDSRNGEDVIWTEEFYIGVPDTTTTTP